MIKQVQAADTAHAMQAYVEALAKAQETGEEGGMGVTSVTGKGLLAGETAWQVLRRDGLSTADRRQGLRSKPQYDYRNQAWLVDGRYVACGHTGTCKTCYGTLHQGEAANLANGEVV